MGRYEGVPERGDDVGTLIRIYKKNREIWDKTYGEKTKRLIRAVDKAYRERKGKDPNYLILGAGTPVRFPEEIDERATVVDRDPRIQKLWEEEGRRATFVVDDVENVIGKMGEKHDVIVLPAILSWLEEEKRVAVKRKLEELLKIGKIVVAWETTHVRRGYQGSTSFSKAFPTDWHEKYVGSATLKIPLGVWTVKPLPVLAGTHVVDPGEEWFVEASIHGEDRTLGQAVLEETREVVERALREAHRDRALTEYMEKKYPELIKHFKPSQV